MSEPTKLHSKICAACQKPIVKGEAYWMINTPDGPKPVHAKCMDKGSKKP